MTDRRPVVIPAGGSIGAEYARALGTPFRSLAPLGPARRPVLQMVVDALRGSGVVGTIICVAPDEVRERISDVDEWLPTEASGPDNILRGLASLDDPDAPALVCTSDLPLLTSDSVREFVARCDPTADVTLGLVGAPAYEQAFPGAPPSQWVALRDAGPVTMSCLFGVRPSLPARNDALLAQAFRARKSQLRMAALLGPRLVWQWATHSLTLAALAARAEFVLAARAQVLRDVPPALSFDMDAQNDYTYANARLGGTRFDGAPRPR